MPSEQLKPLANLRPCSGPKRLKLFLAEAHFLFSALFPSASWTASIKYTEPVYLQCVCSDAAAEAEATSALALNRERAPGAVCLRCLLSSPSQCTPLAGDIGQMDGD